MADTATRPLIHLPADEYERLYCVMLLAESLLSCPPGRRAVFREQLRESLAKYRELNPHAAERA